MKSAGRRLRSKSRAAASACSGENWPRCSRRRSCGFSLRQPRKAARACQETLFRCAPRKFGHCRGGEPHGQGRLDGREAEREARADDAPLKLEEFLPYRLNVAAALASQALSRIYAERYGIGVPEWRVLVTLGEYGAMTGKAIGAHAHMHKTKVSRAVALLERRKLLARRANKADMREAFLSLTPAGRAIYQDLVPVAEAFARRLDRGGRSGRPRRVRPRARGAHRTREETDLAAARRLTFEETP